MKKANLEKIQGTPELISRKWWFLGLFIIIRTMIPPIFTKGFYPSKTGKIISYILRNSLSTFCSLLCSVFKIIPIILIFALILFRNKIGSIFSLYSGITYLLFALLQNIAITETEVNFCYNFEFIDNVIGNFSQ